MKYEEIKDLLDRYWDGETSLEEERRIKTYFSAGPVDERLRSFAPLFTAIRQEQEVRMQTGSKVAPMRPRMYQFAAAAAVALLALAAWWTLRPGTPQDPVVIHQTPSPVIKEALKQTPDLPVQKEEIAVVKKRPVVLPKHKSPAASPTAPVIDEETAKAMAEIKAALALVSSKIEKGRNQAIKGAELLEAVEKVPHKNQG